MSEETKVKGTYQFVSDFGPFSAGEEVELSDDEAAVFGDLITPVDTGGETDAEDAAEEPEAEPAPAGKAFSPIDDEVKAYQDKFEKAVEKSTELATKIAVEKAKKETRESTIKEIVRKNRASVGDMSEKVYLDQQTTEYFPAGYSDVMKAQIAVHFTGNTAASRKIAAVRKANAEHQINYAESLKGTEYESRTKVLTNTTSSGAELIVPRYSDQLWTPPNGFISLRDWCTKLPSDQPGNTFYINEINESSWADGSVWGGLTVQTPNENAEPSDSTPATSQIGVVLREYVITVKASYRELADSNYNVQKLIDEGVGRAFMNRINLEILSGSLSSTKGFKGVKNLGCYISVSKESGQTTADPVEAQNIRKIRQRTFPNIPGKKWAIHPDLVPFIDGMTFTKGGTFPASMPVQNIYTAPPQTIYGDPYSQVTQCSAAGTAGDMILGVWDAYQIYEKPTSMLFLDQTYAANRVVAWQFTYAGGGNCPLQQAITLTNGSTTQSFFAGRETLSAT